VTRDTKLDAKRAAASATLAERFMKREEREIVRSSSFAFAFSGSMSKHIKDTLPADSNLLRFCIGFLIMSRAFYEKREPHAVGESETMLMIVLQINSNYFDGRFPRLNNCPFKHQLAKTRRGSSSNCSVPLDLTDRHCNTWFLSFRRSCKPCNLEHRPAHSRNISRRFLGLIYVWANPVPFHFVPAGFEI